MSRLPSPTRTATATCTDGSATATSNSRSAARPLRRDAERNRQRILAAAGEVFTSRGIDVTLDDIAHHAGLGVGTVYRRFPSREHLVEALFEQRIDEVFDLAAKALTHSSAWQGFVDFLTQTAELLASDCGLRDIMFSSAYGRDAVARARDRLIPVISRIIARAQDDGELRGDLTPTDVPMLEFMAVAVIEYAWQAQPELWRRYLTIVVDGLRAHRDTPTKLPQPALDDAALDETMRTWRPIRHRATPTNQDPA